MCSDPEWCLLGRCHVQGFARQLADSEIYEQAMLFARELSKEGKRLSNVVCALGSRQHQSSDVACTSDQVSGACVVMYLRQVFMGMGEPLANYKNVMSAVRRLNTELGIGARHITISTVGLVPRILRLAEEGWSLVLPAVSKRGLTGESY